MKKNMMQQEILLVTGTSFTSDKLCKKDDSRRDSHLFENEQLEEACWNGLLQAKLPEIFLKAANGNILCIWQIKEAESFLVLDLGEMPAAIDSHFSIVPYSFLSAELDN